MRLFGIKLKQNGLKDISLSSFAVTKEEENLGEIIECKVHLAQPIDNEMITHQLDSGQEIDIPKVKYVGPELIAGLDPHSDISFIRKSQEWKRYSKSGFKDELIHVTTANKSGAQLYRFITLPIVTDITPRLYQQKFYILNKIPGNRDIILGNDYFKSLSIKKSLIFKEL